MIEGHTILCFASGYDAPPTSKHHVEEVGPAQPRVGPLRYVSCKVIVQSMWHMASSEARGSLKGYDNELQA